MPSSESCCEGQSQQQHCKIDRLLLMLKGKEERFLLQSCMQCRDVSDVDKKLINILGSGL